MNLNGMAETSLLHRQGSAYGKLLQGQRSNTAETTGVQSAAATREGLRKVAEEFESIFVYQMLSAMRKTVGDGSLIEKSTGQEIFEGMLDEQWASKLSSRTGPGGLSELLYQQLSRQLGLEEADTSAEAAASVASRVRQLTDQMRSAAGGDVSTSGQSIDLLNLKTLNAVPLLSIGQHK